MTEFDFKPVTDLLAASNYNDWVNNAPGSDPYYDNEYNL